jgi:hypothetical protein
MLTPAQTRFAGTYTFKAKEQNGVLFRENPSVAASFSYGVENQPVFAAKNGVAVVADAKTGNITVYTKKAEPGETARQELFRDKGILGQVAAAIVSARSARSNEDVEAAGVVESQSKSQKTKLFLPELEAVNNFFLQLAADDKNDSPAQPNFEYIGNYKALETKSKF